MSALMSIDRPFVFKNRISSWPASSWSPDGLASVLGDMKTKFRIGKKCAPEVQWEGDCEFVEATFQQFVQWLENGRQEAANPLTRFDRETHWCYADYNYMNTLFADHPELIKAVDWSVFGFGGRDGADSTFWMGSAGAHTVCHYDTYGCNLVAQVYGRKRWVLWSPEDTALLEPTRVPYEESSVFSAVRVHNPDLNKHPGFRNARAHVVTLEPGDVLYVPRHWWHYVVSIETSISVNTWFEMDADDEARLHEAVTRTLMCSLLRDVPSSAWLNPTEVLSDAETNLEYLNRALQNVRTNRTSASEEDGCNRVRQCSGLPVESRSSNTHPIKQIFSDFGITEYTEVTSCSFEEFLSLVQCKQCSSSIASQTTASYMYNPGCGGDHEHSESGERAPKQTKRELENDSTHTLTDTGHARDQSQIIEENESSNESVAMTMELFAQCATHPEVVRLVSKLLTDKSWKKQC